MTDNITEELNKPLDPKHVKEPSGKFGPKGSFIEGWHAIAEANRIFGFMGWSYTIDLIKDSVEIATTQKGDQWQAAYTCVCTVTVGNVTRQDVGFGSGFAKQIGDAIEGATKEAATDALKRALRTFGNPFGLALYDKSRENVQAPFDSAAARTRLKEAMQKVNDAKVLEKFWAQDNVTATISQLSEPHRNEVIKAHTDRQAELS